MVDFSNTWQSYNIFYSYTNIFFTLLQKNANYLHIPQKFRTFAEKLGREMKAKWTSLIREAAGQIDKNHYTRHIPGNKEYAAVCNKPELSKKTKVKKAALPVAQNFKTLIATCKIILKDPTKRAEWQARYDEAKRKASRHNKPIQGRLCDYVRHEVSLAIKNGENVG